MLDFQWVILEGTFPLYELRPCPPARGGAFGPPGGNKKKIGFVLLQNIGKTAPKIWKLRLIGFGGHFPIFLQISNFLGKAETKILPTFILFWAGGLKPLSNRQAGSQFMSASQHVLYAPWEFSFRTTDSTCDLTCCGRLLMMLYNTFTSPAVEFRYRIFKCVLDCFSGNDKRPGSRGFKKLSEFGDSSLQGYKSSQNTCLIVFRGKQRGADDQLLISVDFLNP